MNDLLPLPTSAPDRIEIEQVDYDPLIILRAFRGDEMIYRRLIRKEQEAEVRRLLSSTS